MVGKSVQRLTSRTMLRSVCAVRATAFRFYTGHAPPVVVVDTLHHAMLLRSIGNEGLITVSQRQSCEREGLKWSVLKVFIRGFKAVSNAILMIVQMVREMRTDGSGGDAYYPSWSHEFEEILGQHGYRQPFILNNQTL